MFSVVNQSRKQFPCFLNAIITNRNCEGFSMKKWVALQGNFQENDEIITFIGGESEYIDNKSGENKKTGKIGKLMFEDGFVNGSIEMTVEFESLNHGDEIQIIFDYKDYNDFSCVGIANSEYKYEYKYFDGKWNWGELVGYDIELAPKTEYIIKAEIIGSVITLFINNVKIFSTYSKNFLSRTNVGIWTRSQSIIKIHDFKATFEKPKAFIVMQFDKNYNELYTDVIKPVCENNGYDVCRADEGVNTGLILQDIIDAIQNSAIIIADISPNNPNVFYEIGFSHALNKPTILLNEKTSREHLPFDVSGFRTIFYDNSIGGKRDVEEKLSKFLINISANIPRI